MRHLFALLLATSMSLLVACGGGDAVDTPAPAEATPAAVEAPPEPPPEATPAPATVAVPTGPMALQAEGSELSFSARKNDESDVVGRFTQLSGTLTVPNGDLGQAQGSITVAWIGGVKTDEQLRDENIISAFFGALDDTAPKGSVSLNSLEVKKPSLEIGESTVGNAFVDVGAGMSMMGLAVPVKVERVALDQYKVTLTEQAEVSIDKLGMSVRKKALIELCQHKSVGDVIKIGGSFVFGG